MKRILWLLLSVVSGGLMAQDKTSGRDSLYHHTPEIVHHLDHTKLEVSFNFEKQELYGKEYLTAYPYFYPSGTLTLQAQSMEIHQVSLYQNKSLKDLKYNHQGSDLVIHLDKVYQRGEKYTIYIEYTARPEQFKDPHTGKKAKSKGLFFINPMGYEKGKPTQIWTQGQPDRASCWFPTIDSPNQKTTQELSIIVPDEYVTLSNGLLKEKKSLGNGLRKDYWVMDKKHAPYLFFMGVGKFDIVKDKAWRNKVGVEYYVEQEYSKVAKRIFAHTTEMIEFFSGKLGYDFPWQKYSQMIVREFISGAMENTTAVAFSEIANQSENDLNDENLVETIVAHELMHHWFGNLVTAESWSNISVNESFANYSEYLWLEYKYGKDRAMAHLNNDLDQYYHENNDFAKRLVRFGYDKYEDLFDLVSYNKGGAILHMLRDYLGDDAFFESMQLYLKANEYSTGEVHQFRLACEKVSGKDLNWFFNQWFFGYGHPELKVSYLYDSQKGEIALSVVQAQDKSIYFEFPLEVDILVSGKLKREKVWVKAKQKNDFYFKVENKPELVNLDPRGVIVSKKTSEYKTQEEYIKQYEVSTDYYSRLKAVEYAKEYYVEELLIKALQDPYWGIRALALSNLKNTEAVQGLGIKIRDIALNDPDYKVRAEAIGLCIKAKLGDEEFYKLAYKMSSSAVKSMSLLGIYAFNDALAIQILKEDALINLHQDALFLLFREIEYYKIERYAPQVAKIGIYYPYVEAGGLMQSGLLNSLSWALSLEDASIFDALISELRSIPHRNDQLKKMYKEVVEFSISQKQQLLKRAKDKDLVQKQLEVLRDMQE